jgi:flagellar basal-body rod modification protein FlgD
MAISVNSVSTTNNAATSSQAKKDDMVGLGDNLNSFLTMLTTQLRNQDPMSPLDTNQFTQQLVSFSQVEQAIKTNTQLASLVSLISTNTLASSLSLVGKKVAVDSAQMGLVDGEAQFSYTLPSTAKETSLVVSDASGNIVWQGSGETAAGMHGFTWDGKDSSGRPMPDGTYKLEVGAQGLDGAILTVPVSSFGTVDGVLMKDGAASLAFGTFEAPTTKLLAVLN